MKLLPKIGLAFLSAAMVLALAFPARAMLCSMTEACQPCCPVSIQPKAPSQTPEFQSENNCCQWLESRISPALTVRSEGSTGKTFHAIDHGFIVSSAKITPHLGLAWASLTIAQGISFASPSLYLLNSSLLI